MLLNADGVDGKSLIFLFKKSKKLDLYFPETLLQIAYYYGHLQIVKS